MSSSRDEILYIPEKDMGGFMCPNCLLIAIGHKWASHANYCPDCGQHIKIIEPVKFQEMKKAIKELPEEVRENCIKTYQIIGPEGYNKEEISGIYNDRFKKAQADASDIEGQMNIRNFI